MRQSVKLRETIDAKRGHIAALFNDHRRVDGEYDLTPEQVEEIRAGNAELEDLIERLRKAEEIEEVERSIADPDGFTLKGGFGDSGLSSKGYQPKRDAGVRSARWLGAAVGSKALSRLTTGFDAILPVQYFDRVVDDLRASTVALQAGITLVTTNAQKLIIPKTTTLPTAAWTAEGAAITTSDPGMASIEAEPKKLAALVVTSNELLKDSNPLALGIVEHQLALSLSLALDAAIFAGSGSENQPTGISNTTGIQTVAAGGGLTNFDTFAKAAGKLAAKNAKADAVVMHPDVWSGLLLIKESSGSNLPLLLANANPSQGVAGSIYGMKVYLSSQLDAGTAYVVEADQVVLVMREEVSLFVDPYSLAAKDQTQIRATLRADVVIPNPLAICLISGITTS